MVVQENEPFVTVSIDIAAPPQTVWRVLTEFGRYPAWHPVLSFDGTEPELAPGALLPIRLSGGAAGDQAFTAELTQVSPPRRLIWEGGIRDVFFGRHSFELQGLPGNGTRFTDTERWSGTMAASVIAEHHAVLEKEYARSAAALKQQAERESTAPAPAP